MQTKVTACRKLHAEAVKSFQRAAAAAPADARPLFRLGNALFAAHQLAQSQEAFSEALEAATLPDDAALLPKIHVNLGISLEADGQLVSACQHYRSAVAVAAHPQPQTLQNFQTKVLMLTMCTLP